MTAAPANLSERIASKQERDVWRILVDVPDPEIPVLNVVELGIIRYVRVASGDRVTVGVSPTYTGCPAPFFDWTGATANSHTTAPPSCALRHARR